MVKIVKHLCPDCQSAKTRNIAVNNTNEYIETFYQCMDCKTVFCETEQTYKRSFWEFGTL